MESVINQYLNVVRPMHNQFIEPTKNMLILLFQKVEVIR